MDKPLVVDAPKPLTWADLCADRTLQNLPFKIELNALNQIVMAPADARHSRYQGEIAALLRRLLKGGKSFPELAVNTRDNVKAPDVVWASRKTIKVHENESTWSGAPEICVEVLSPTSSKAEITAKCHLYFEQGAQEVWLCSLDGEMSFYSSEGQLPLSVLCPKFPLRASCETPRAFRQDGNGCSFPLSS